MLKFNRAAGNQAFSTAATGPRTFPLGPWTLAFFVRFDGLLTGDNPQYLFSTGAYQSAGSLNVYYNTSATTTVPTTPINAVASRIVVVSDTMDASAPPLISQPLTSGTHLIVIASDGTTATMRHCPVLSTAPTNGSAVIAAASSTNPQLVRELVGSGFMWASRLDGAAARKADLSLSRGLVVLRTLTDLEVARLAFGEEITDLGYTPKVYTRMSSVSDVTDRSPNNYTFTISGSPTTSSEPAFGYVPGSTEPPPNTLTLDENHANEAFFDNNGATVVFSGSYSGTAPTSVEILLSGRSYAPLSAFVASGGLFSGSLSVPAGGPYTYTARSKSGTTVLATSQTSAESFIVGALGAAIGSSSAEYLFTDKSGTGYAPSAQTRLLSGATPAWSRMSTNGAGTVMASDLVAKLGKPFAWVSYGVAGTNLAQWLNKSGTQWQNFLKGLAKAGGWLTVVYITIGSNDAGNNAITSSNSHLANMLQFESNIREALRVKMGAAADLVLFLWSGSNRRPPLNPVQADRLRQAESQIGKYPRIAHVQTIDFKVASDNVHLDPGPDGYLASGKLAVNVIGRALVDGVETSKLRGPSISGWTFSDKTVTATLTHHDGNNFTPTSPDGFIVSSKQANGTWVPVNIVSTQKINANRIDIVTDTVLVEPRATYRSGSDPKATAPVYSNGPYPYGMLVETELPVIQGVDTPVVVPPTDDPNAPGIFVSTIMSAQDIYLTTVLL